MRRGEVPGEIGEPIILPVQVSQGVEQDWKERDRVFRAEGEEGSVRLQSGIARALSHLSNSLDIAQGWCSEKAAVFAAELGRALVPHLVGG